MRATQIIGFMGVAGCVVALAAAQDTTPGELPSGAEVLDRYVEACGGVAAFDKLRNRVVQARFVAYGPEDEPVGFPGTMTIYTARPNLTYTIAHIDRVTRSETGCDGNVVWDSNTRTGSRIKEGEARLQAMMDAVFYKDIYWRTVYDSAECVGVETVDGKPMYKVRLTPKKGQPETRFFDQKTGLLARAVVHMSDGSSLPTTYHKYREVDGILLAHGQSQTIGNRLEVTFTHVEHNADLPVEIFQPPQVIMDMIARGETQAAPTRAGTQRDMGPGRGISAGPPQLRKLPKPKEPEQPPAPEQPSDGG